MSVMELLERFRAKRQSVYEGLFGAKVLCAAGLVIMPTLLFAPHPNLLVSVMIKTLLFLLLWFLAWLCGKKNRPLFTILMIVFIVAFNLIFPLGRVLFSIGAFRITDGALLMGIQRAVTLVSLIMLSRIMIRPDLKIPGRFGEMVGDSLKLYAVIMNQRQRITRKNLIGDIDQMLIELSSGQTLQPDAAAASRTRPAGFVILAAAALLFWVFWYFSEITVTLILFAWFNLQILLGGAGF